MGFWRGLLGRDFARAGFLFRHRRTCAPMVLVERERGGEQPEVEPVSEDCAAARPGTSRSAGVCVERWVREPLLLHRGAFSCRHSS